MNDCQILNLIYLNNRAKFIEGYSWIKNSEKKDDLETCVRDLVDTYIRCENDLVEDFSFIMKHSSNPENLHFPESPDMIRADNFSTLVSDVISDVVWKVYDRFNEEIWHDNNTLISQDEVKEYVHQIRAAFVDIIALFDFEKDEELSDFDRNIFQ